jgi:uncharacterized OB-fold protein
VSEVLDARPIPVADLDSLGYWEAARAHELRLQRCEQCGRWNHFPSPICPKCGSRRLRWTPTGGRGTIHTYVVVHHAVIRGFEDRVPYTVAWIELDEQPGLRVLSDIVDCPPERVQIGMPVEVVFEELGEVTLPHFRPVATADSPRSPLTASTADTGEPSA